MRRGIQRGAPGASPEPRNDKIATVFVTFAAACSLAGLAGWAFDIPVLRNFGVGTLPIWPLTAIGYLALVLGFLAVMRGARQVAFALWALPVAIALLSIVQWAAGIDLGTDRLLFGSLVETYPVAHPGRPGPNPTTIFLLSALAGYGAGHWPWSRDELARLVVSASLALGLLALVVVLLLTPRDPLSQTFSTSAPSTLAALSMVAAFVVRHGAFGWDQVFRSERTELKFLRVLLPFVLILPAFPALLDFAFSGLMSPMTAKLTGVILNVLMVAALTYWSATRLAGQQSEVSAFTEALDVATVAMTDAEGRITHWSRGCEQLYGWPAGEAVGQDKYALLRSRCEELGKSGLPGAGAPDIQTLVERCCDGREVMVLERSHRLERPGREPLTVLSMTDISETATAAAALQASEELLAVAAAVHELGVFEWDVPSGRIDWSPGTEQRLGIVPGSISDFESWRAMVEPDDMEDVLDTIARTVADHADKFSFRCRFLQPNGDVRSVEGTSRAFYDDEGNLVRAVGTMMDVTERDQREAALRRREAQLRSILRTVPDAMVVIDEGGTIRQFSVAAEELWGYRAADVIGSNIAMLAPEDDRIRYTETLEKFLETGEGQFLKRVVTGTGETASGRRFPLEFHTGQAQADGETLFTIFFRDLTERLAAEERLSELNDDLAHVSRQSAMSELAADIAHELNQPLAATANFLAAAKMLIEKGEEIDRVSDLLRMGAEQTQRAGQIIRRMRDFMSRREVEMRVESVETTVQGAAELVLVGTGQFHIRLTCDFDPAAEQVFADKIQVQQVLVNLLRNAIQALRTSPADQREIVVTSRKAEDQMVSISVCDSGPGIPEKVLNQMFTRFVTTKGSGAGMGIGLSISKRIVEAHGGMLIAENRPEGGACFRFTLPAAGEEDLE